MSVQIRQDNTNKPFVLHSKPAAVIHDMVMAQDAGRAAVLKPYTVLGKKRVSATSITADVGNTGDGTFTALALAAPGKAQAGTYNLECVKAVTNGGVFKLEDPNGNILVNDLTLTVGAGAATVFIVAGMTFTITDGATDFIVGDKAAIVITAGTQYYPMDGAAVDGLEQFAGIYMGPEIAAATLVAGSVSELQLLLGGAFIDKNQLVFENSLTLATVLPSGKTLEEEMRQLDIWAQDTVEISGFENT